LRDIGRESSIEMYTHDNRRLCETRVLDGIDVQDACRRMKIKCVEKETPPCHRCREIGESCTFLMKNNIKPSESECVTLAVLVLS